MPIEQWRWVPIEQWRCGCVLGYAEGVVRRAQKDDVALTFWASVAM